MQGERSELQLQGINKPYSINPWVPTFAKLFSQEFNLYTVNTFTLAIEAKPSFPLRGNFTLKLLTEEAQIGGIFTTTGSHNRPKISQTSLNGGKLQ